MCPGRRGCPAGWRPVLCTTLVMLGPLRPPSEPCTAGYQTVLVGCYDRHLYCLDFSDGAIRWKVSLGGMIKCSALVLRETLLCGSYESNLVVRLRSEDGLLLWSRQVEGSVLASPVLDDAGVIVATLRGLLYKLSLNTGDVVWRLELGHPVFGTPLVCMDSVLVPSVNNSLYRVSREGGKCEGSVSTEAPVFSSPVSLSDRRAVFGCQDGHLYLVSLDQTGLSLVRRTPVGGGVTGAPDTCLRHRLLVCATTAGAVNLLSEDGDILHSHQLPGEVFSSPLIYKVSLLTDLIRTITLLTYRDTCWSAVEMITSTVWGSAAGKTTNRSRTEQLGAADTTHYNITLLLQSLYNLTSQC